MLERLRRGREEGFTLIELLVVVIIIGILAAIAIPAFLGQQSKAEESAAKSLIRNGQTAVEAAYVDKRAYNSITAPDLKAIEPTLTFVTTGEGQSNTDTVAYTNTAATAYKLSAQAGSSGKIFSLTRNSDGTQTRACGTGCTW